MKKVCFMFMVFVLFLGIFFPMESVKANTIPIIEVVGFQGTPQALVPEVRNSGTITLSVNLGDYDLESLNKGKVTVRNYDGTETVLTNIWQCQSDDICTWEQYLAFEVEYVFIQTQTPILWLGSGPWEGSYQPFGIHKVEQITSITFSVNDPLYRDWDGLYYPTWDWAVVGEPEWAASQWFEYNRVSIEISTNCNGHATNHEGIFAWEDVPTLPSMFGNGVYRQWVKEPLSTVEWKMEGTVGNLWSQNGETLGPTCWNNLTFLPLINN